ncbi:ATP-grasp domain-containing protein [Nitrincola sp.]|uniref:ATP-grasp domain-containing protein n=1 Tax=Nitrincola sp. TaxID=1926584 RepID=UPI003A915B7E
MNIVSFDAFRTLRLPGVTFIKPENMFRQKDEILAADWVLFPEYWQVNALVFGLKKKIFPSLPSYLLGHNKIEMTRAFRLLVPANTPETAIHANTESRVAEVWDKMDLPFVAKIPKSSMGEGVFLIENRADWTAYLARTDIIYAQEYLPIDRDMRIIIVGKQLVAGYWRLQGQDGFHNNVSRGGQVDLSPLHPAAIKLALHLAEVLNLDHAGFDIAMVGDHPYVLEFNRLFGNTGLPDLHVRVADAIQAYIHEQTDRDDDPQGPQRPQPPLPIAV